MNKKKRKFKKRKIIIPLICIIVVGAITFALAYKKYSDSFIKVIPVSEAVGMFNHDGVGKILIKGSLKKGSVQNVNVNNELNIGEVKVEKGDTVKKGDVLIAYDTNLLQLNVDAQQTQIDILTNQIKIAENELVTLKGLIPAENAPVEQPPVEEIPTEAPTNVTVEEDEPVVFEYEKQITEKTTPLSGDGSKSSPFVFNVGEDTVVTKQYMQYLAGNNTANITTSATESATKATEGATQATKDDSRYAIFHMYSTDGTLLYSWLVDGTKITDGDIANWQCSNGVVISEDGSIQVAQGTNLFATLVTYNQSNSDLYDEGSLEDIYSEYLSGNVEIPAEYEDVQNGLIADSEDAVVNQNYMYTQAELQSMISAKEDEIDDLEFSKRQAEIDLNNAQKDLENGGEVANIDGTVAFVAQSNEQAIKEGAYVTVVNDSITTVVGSVSENDLPNVSVGMKVTASNDITSEEFEGEIIQIAEEASVGQGGYDEYGLYDDTVSYYDVTVELSKKVDIKEDESVTIIADTNEATESVWLDNAFVRIENGKTYVMVATDDNVIEKRYVETGQSYFGLSTEITSGLSLEDRIALPYGKTQEGKPVVDATFEELYMGFLF